MRQRQFFSDLDIARAGEKFLDRSLPKPEWTHPAHFAVTLWLLRHRPALDLDETLPDLIRGFNEATGTANTDTGGYHWRNDHQGLAGGGKGASYPVPRAVLDRDSGRAAGFAFGRFRLVAGLLEQRAATFPVAARRFHESFRRI